MLWATRDEAQHLLTDRLTRGLPPAESKVATGPVNTVGELIDRWRARQQERADRSERTLAHYDKAARHVVA